MSRPRFLLADHDFNEHIIDGLLRREPAIEITRARDARLHEEPDERVLAFAAERRLLVLSHDVNTMPAGAFARLAAGQPVAGLIMVRQVNPVAGAIEDLMLIWSASEAEERNGQVWFLPI